MGQMRCPVLIGRGEERRQIEEALVAAAAANGSALALTGEAGMGKSRLAREAANLAANQGFAVLRGRAAIGAGPFRAVAEALLSWMRGRDLASEPDVALFWRTLGLAAPTAARATGAPMPLAAIAEASARVLRVAAGATGCLLVIEDLHWADGDSLQVVDYLADAIESERVCLLVTARDGESSPGLDAIRAMHRRRSLDVLPLPRLAEEDLLDMVRACLHRADLDHALAEYLVGAADGLPFLVEELLATLAQSGCIREIDSSWQLVDALPSTVPASFAASVRDRAATISPLAQRALQTAAVLGRRFSWLVLAAVTDAQPAAILSALQETVTRQLTEPTDEAEWFRFRHALTRDAILGDLLPGERVMLAAQAASEIERLHPELDQDWRTVAADLWAVAEHRERAAELFCELGRRSLRLGALVSAETALRRSGDLDSEDIFATGRDALLLEVLALAGRTDEAFAVGAQLLDDSAAKRFDIRLLLARAAIAGNRWDVAAAHLDAVDRGMEPGDLATRAERDALAAHVALGFGHLDDATSLAANAERTALEVGLPEIACEALEATGRCARERGLREAEDVFARTAALAEEAGLPLRRIRALHELGTIDLFTHADPTRLAVARDLALADGQVATAGYLELHIAACYSVRFDSDHARAAADRCAALARRCDLRPLLALARTFVANSHAQRGDSEAMEAAIAEALEISGDDLQISNTVWGSCRAEAAAVFDDRDALVAHTRRAAEALLDAGQTTPAPSWGTWCLLAAVDDFDDRGASGAPGPQVHRVVRGMVTLAEAVRVGRAGRHDDAELTFAAGDEDLAYLPWRRHFARRLAADAALTDGWGDPIGWVTDALAYFAERGYPRIATGCRTFLHSAGRPVPRRGRGATAVPSALLSQRVTTREADVLVLVGRGLANGDIAEELCLSRRTIEFHISNLLAKTGADGRRALTRLAQEAWPESTPPTK